MSFKKGDIVFGPFVSRDAEQHPYGYEPHHPSDGYSTGKGRVTQDFKEGDEWVYVKVLEGNRRSGGYFVSSLNSNLCPRCERAPFILPDYLCRRCRYG